MRLTRGGFVPDTAIMRSPGDAVAEAVAAPWTVGRWRVDGDIVGDVHLLRNPSRYGVTFSVTREAHYVPYRHREPRVIRAARSKRPARLVLRIPEWTHEQVEDFKRLWQNRMPLR